MATGNQLPADLENEVSKANGKVSRVMGEIGIAIATSDDPKFADKAARIAGVGSVIRDAEAQWINPPAVYTDQGVLDNVTGQSATNPATNPFFQFQWGHKAINAPAAWAAGYQGEGVRVAVLDGGFDLDHPDLAANIVYSRSFVPGESAQYALGDVGSHGTHTAGTVAALDNNIGVVGVAPKANLLLIKVLRDSGSGSFSWLLQGVLDAVNQKADVISMSLGTFLLRNGKYLDDNGTPADPSDDFIGHDAKGTQELINALTRVMNYAHSQGVTLVAAAGNDAIDGNKDGSGLSIPANLPNVLSISATGPAGWFANRTTNLDRFASYSNYGTPDVTFAAPGGDFSLYPTANWQYDMVLSTGNSPGAAGQYYFSAGTSMACPHAAGVAALIIGKNGGQMDPTRVEAALRASADDLGKTGRDPLFGYGRVNAYRAVSAVQ
ncbi:peptidase S8 and S53 subtilisin kexin sedolisin [Fibrisoma limi BUZ 3]|uniref:Peptidase S8 and S53 subtilisin kexin sedolisin n=2 Tax=Fibrisoma limi TaxID=663275 RepID=I2GTR6_9BACT|nr:peptidase S8 and S53 subtilisin kexin sedolisin [Fibrisoma limi BUZ 3]